MWQNNVAIYRQIPAIQFSKGLIFAGAYILRGLYTKANLHLKINWASL